MMSPLGLRMFGPVFTTLYWLIFFLLHFYYPLATTTKEKPAPQTHTHTQTHAGRIATMIMARSCLFGCASFYESCSMICYSSFYFNLVGIIMRMNSPAAAAAAVAAAAVCVCMCRPGGHRFIPVTYYSSPYTAASLTYTGIINICNAHRTCIGLAEGGTGVCMCVRWETNLQPCVYLIRLTRTSPPGLHTYTHTATHTRFMYACVRVRRQPSGK